MTRSSCLLLGLLLLSCGGKGAARLEGTWKGQRAEGVSGAQEEAANLFAKGTELVFHGDVMTIHTPDASPQSSKFKVAKQDKTSVVVVSLLDGEKDAQKFLLEGDSTLKWAVMDGKTLVFKKQ